MPGGGSPAISSENSGESAKPLESKRWKQSETGFRRRVPGLLTRAGGAEPLERRKNIRGTKGDAKMCEYCHRVWGAQKNRNEERGAK